MAAPCSVSACRAACALVSPLGWQTPDWPEPWLREGGVRRLPLGFAADGSALFLRARCVSGPASVSSGEQTTPCLQVRVLGRRHERDATQMWPGTSVGLYSLTPHPEQWVARLGLVKHPPFSDRCAQQATGMPGITQACSVTWARPPLLNPGLFKKTERNAQKLVLFRVCFQQT